MGVKTPGLGKKIGLKGRILGFFQENRLGTLEGEKGLERDKRGDRRLCNSDKGKTTGKRNGRKGDAMEAK